MTHDTELSSATPAAQEVLSLDASDIRNLIGVALSAGVAAVRLRDMAGRNGIASNKKPDHSPVTDADVEAERIILAGIAEHVPGVPTISEEQSSAGLQPMIAPNATYFLVDPLDGTREFISGGSDFTVNIALVIDQVPRFGIVYAPALSEMFWGEAGKAGWVAQIDPTPILPEQLDQAIHTASLLPNRSGTGNMPNQNLRATTSRSHGSPNTTKLLDHLGISQCVLAGSSLKFCRVADGSAEIYPRFGRTMTWDTAAGHAILSSIGGVTLALDGSPLKYDPSRSVPDNPHFVALSDKALTDRVISAVAVSRL